MNEAGHRTARVDHVLDGFPLYGPPPEGQSTPAYRPVGVYDRSGWLWRGTITAWWISPEGVTTCRLRLAGARTPRWTVFDAERIILLTQGGT